MTSSQQITFLNLITMRAVKYDCYYLKRGWDSVSANSVLARLPNMQLSLALSAPPSRLVSPTENSRLAVTGTSYSAHFVIQTAPRKGYTPS